MFYIGWRWGVVKGKRKEITKIREVISKFEYPP
jgi:hypothetical protein